MEKFLDRKRLNRLKQQYKAGRQVQIEVKSGAEGEEVVTETATIKEVDDAGGIHVYIKEKEEVILISTQNEAMLLDSEYSRKKDV